MRILHRGKSTPSIRVRSAKTENTRFAVKGARRLLRKYVHRIFETDYLWLMKIENISCSLITRIIVACLLIY